MKTIKSTDVKKNIYKNIKSGYILKQIFDNIPENKLYKIIKINKNIQKRLNININNYIKLHNKIILEIFPINKEDRNNFINILIPEKPFYHIYFNNDERKEINKDYFTIEDKVRKIKIIIDDNIKSLKDLFNGCICIKKIIFKKFNTKDIKDMSNMFYGCTSLEEINLNEFNTDKVTNMRNMFFQCSSL